MSAASRSGRGIVNVSSKVVRNPAASVKGNFVSSSATGVDRPIGTASSDKDLPLGRHVPMSAMRQWRFSSGAGTTYFSLWNETWAVSAADITGPLVERVCVPGWGQGHHPPASRHLPPASSIASPPGSPVHEIAPSLVVQRPSPRGRSGVKLGNELPGSSYPVSSGALQFRRFSLTLTGAGTLLVSTDVLGPLKFLAHRPSPFFRKGRDERPQPLPLSYCLGGAIGP
jgi:hypothetical protein